MPCLANLDSEELRARAVGLAALDSHSALVVREWVGELLAVLEIVLPAVGLEQIRKSLTCRLISSRAECVPLLLLPEHILKVLHKLVLVRSQLVARFAVAVKVGLNLKSNLLG